MENVVKFTPRLPKSDPQREHFMAIRDVNLSLAQNARTLISSLASLGESLRKADALICYIDDAEVRAQLRLNSAPIYSELLNAVIKVLTAAAVCQE